MLRENDSIKREIQRLTLLVSRMIEKALGLSMDDYEQETQKIAVELKKEFDLNLSEIYQMEDAVLISKIGNLHETHIEKLAELLSVLSEKETDSNSSNQLKKKALVLLNYLDENSKTFSFARMELGKSLNKVVNRLKN